MYREEQARPLGKAEGLRAFQELPSALQELPKEFLYEKEAIRLPAMAETIIKSDHYYTRRHEWAREEEGKLVVGITDYAQASLGDIVYLELKAVGASLEAEESFGVVESVKAVEELYAPVGGTIAAVNEKLCQSPQELNQDPYHAWTIRLENYSRELLDRLMSPNEYSDYVGSL